jgi:16S rRNA (guanine966-N2)-methyltransferase
VTLRITGGEVKGRRLSAFKGAKIRPTSDKVREAIFDLIGQDARGLRVLDLFAGTGSLGIEALSRGAAWVLFADNSMHSIELIRRNLSLCGYENLSYVLKKDLTRGIPKKCEVMKREIDLVFTDPPYGRDYIPPVLRELSEREILASPSIVVAETSKAETLPASLGKLELVKARIYGDTKISVYRYGHLR